MTPEERQFRLEEALEEMKASKGLSYVCKCQKEGRFDDAAFVQRWLRIQTFVAALPRIGALIVGLAIVATAVAAWLK